MATSETLRPLAVQLYSLRHLEQSLDEKLAAVASIGYAGVETIGDHGLPASEMKALLEKHGLRAVSTHVGLQAVETELAKIIDFNQAIGNRHIVIPAIPQEQRPTDAAGWQALGQKLDRLGQQCAQAGMQLLYHNHAWEMALLDGKLAIDWLLEAADPAHLAWEPDLAWVARGGADGVELLQRYAGRCPRIHVKDLAPAGQGEDEMGFADVGHGTLNWDQLLPAAKAAGGEWYIVEHDLPKDPLRTIRRSFEFLQSRVG
ncbi:sugar phosphate isomerase/epimerase [Litorilinea aerophila]|uniref:Sugar phosphate isomerase/epimerase n=1 Tax=Litorilinea aerophila TaxID=1204385 RepID=A0A540VDM1_9CHLR|nr:sugar phosphate isomerase/epimerase [Litorilinea aerophila]MCC9077375.1 sugar phosphate isomerase/epimerase [Litorilinea aerophila]GIV76249.1 MAG: xylose isomerase [Litorilinea sp.]